MPTNSPTISQDSDILTPSSSEDSFTFSTLLIACIISMCIACCSMAIIIFIYKYYKRHKKTKPQKKSSKIMEMKVMEHAPRKHQNQPKVDDIDEYTNKNESEQLPKIRVNINNLPRNELITVNSNSSIVHNVNMINLSMNVDRIDSIMDDEDIYEHKKEAKMSAGFIVDEKEEHTEDIGVTGGFETGTTGTTDEGTGTGTGTGTGSDELEVTKEPSSHPTNSSNDNDIIALPMHITNTKTDNRGDIALPLQTQGGTKHYHTSGFYE